MARRIHKLFAGSVGRDGAIILTTKADEYTGAELARERCWYLSQTAEVFVSRLGLRDDRGCETCMVEHDRYLTLALTRETRRLRRARLHAARVAGRRSIFAPVVV